MMQSQTRIQAILLALLIGVWIAQIYLTIFSLTQFNNLESRIRALEGRQSGVFIGNESMPLNEPPPENVDVQTLLSDVRPYQQQTLGKGDGNPIQVVVFEDFLCGYCRLLHTNTLQSLEKNPSRLDALGAPLVVTYRHFNIFGERSLQLSYAVECAGKLGGAAAYQTARDALYSGIADSPQTLFAHLQQVHQLDQKALETCQNDAAIREAVQKDLDIGKRASVLGTPAVFVNGRRIGGYLGEEDFLRQVQADQ